MTNSEILLLKFVFLHSNHLKFVPKTNFLKISGLRHFGLHLFQTDDLRDHIIICGFGRVGQVSCFFSGMIYQF